MKAIKAVILLLLNLSNCFAQSEDSFLMYNVESNKCLTSTLRLGNCDPHNAQQKFRWTSDNRILSILTKTCLGVGSKNLGRNLQLLMCDGDRDLKRWECRNDAFLGIKNESLFLASHFTGLLEITNTTKKTTKWTIHGTQNSICSQPYEEIYTIDGNGFGQPCQFPFKYEKKWYADCTTVDEHNKRPWCATQTDYSVSEQWGYCPTRDSKYWTKHPLTNVYYQLNDKSTLTWYQARKSCQQQGAELLSVTEPHEQTFIAGLVQRSQGSLWIGLNKLDLTSGWQWSNGQPLRYLKWLSGYPITQPGYNCGAMKNGFGSEWSNEACSEKHGYVCQRGHSVPTLPPVVNTGFCHSPWIPYSGNCYFLYRTKRTWLEARDACVREGGDLLSILSTEEHSFAITQLGYSKTDELWIGLNDRKTQMLFDWSDQSSVPFATWEIGEPTHSALHPEDCVLMRGEEGKWADEVCDKQHGFICKRKTSSKASSNDTVVTNPGCKQGWTRYGYYCYMAGSETKTFEEAKQMCEKDQSQLVDVSSRVENAFLVSLVGARPEKYFWIGLSNQKDKHTFEWTNTNKVPFTHFNTGMPGRKNGCVAMTTGIIAGLWDVISCTNKEKYICKQTAEGLVTTKAPPTTPALTCPEEWTELGTRDFCVKHFDVQSNQMKTWDEALDYCREIGGDLLSIHHHSDIPWNYRGGYPSWIGYRMYDPSVGFVWSDGSPSSYQSWASDEPNNLNNRENCVEMRISIWDDDGMWNDINCQDRKDWYCQIRKGKTPIEVNVTAIVYNETEDGWIEFRGSQYYMSRYSAMSMHDARAYCKKKHSELVIINDEEEHLFLWHKSKQSHSDVFIGLSVDLDGSFQWIDGSPVVFDAWEENQPAFKNSEERCTKMTLTQGLWETVNCGDEYDFICKRSETPPVNATVAPIQQPKGGCAPEWKQLEGKCYYMKEELKTWKEAREYCRELGGDLGSILSRPHQVFLSTMIQDKTTDLWIGFSNLANGRFRWTDGSKVSFADWAKGEPHSYWHNYWAKHYFHDQGECVYMSKGSGSDLAKWVAVDCNSTNGFICSRGVDPGIAPAPTEIPKTYFKLGNSSFKIIQENLTWTEANNRCKAEGGNLASIRNLLSQAYIELQIFRVQQPMWIGLNNAESNGYFLWANNWPMNIEKWASSEPKANRPCVYMQVGGEWTTSLCNQTFYSVCEQTSDIAPTLPPQQPGHCPEQEEGSSIRWIPYRDSCYAFVTDTKSWGRSSRFCMAWGASLVSIRDDAEEKFLESNLMLLESYNEFWIGLIHNFKGHWLWSDNSVVDYTNWASVTDYEDDYGDHTWNPDCAFISAKSKKWKKRHCDYSHLPFICKIAKVMNPTIKSSHQDSESHRVNTGLAIFFTIAVISLLGAIAYAYYRRSRNQAMPTFENPMYNNTENIYSDKDNKTLLDHIQIAE